MNDFLCDVNDIIMKIKDLNIITKNLSKCDFDFNGIDSYISSSDFKNFRSIALNIKSLKERLEEIDVTQRGKSSIEKYIQKSIELSNKILDFNSFQNICKKFERKALNYYYLIPQKIRQKHADIIKTLSEATKNDMDGFDIYGFKRELFEFIQIINDEIRGYKLKESNYYDMELQK